MLQEHGDIPSLGFRFGGVAYSPDISALPGILHALLRGLDLWIVDALRYTPHPSHFSLKQALDWIERLGAKRAILTHMTADLDYETLKRDLPPHVEPAYDGMVIELADHASLLLVSWCRRLRSRRESSRSRRWPRTREAQARRASGATSSGGGSGLGSSPGKALARICVRIGPGSTIDTRSPVVRAFRGVGPAPASRVPPSTPHRVPNRPCRRRRRSTSRRSRVPRPTI